jgi:hypothetical protein
VANADLVLRQDLSAYDLFNYSCRRLETTKWCLHENTAINTITPQQKDGAK